MSLKLEAGVLVGLAVLVIDINQDTVIAKQQEIGWS